MVLLHRTSLWLATLMACVGMSCIAIFLLNRSHDAELLSSAASAAMFSTMLVLVSVIFTGFASGRRARRNSARWVFPPLGPVTAPLLTDQQQQRQEALSERLHIDEPRFCTQAQAPCTAWSFCGSTPPERPMTFVKNPEEPGLASPPEMLHENSLLPIIQRSGVPLTSCLGLSSKAKSGDKLPGSCQDGN